MNIHTVQKKILTALSKSQKRCLALLLLYAAYVNCFGQDLNYRLFTIEEGLPSAYLYDVLQDEDGFIWLSTEEGVCRFDGHVFETNPIPSIQGEEIITFLLDEKEGGIWMASLSGEVLYYHNRNLEKYGPFVFYDGGDSITIQTSHLYMDADGTVWGMSKYGFVTRMEKDENGGRKPPHIFRLPFSSPLGVYEDGDTIIFTANQIINKIYGDSLWTIEYGPGYQMNSRTGWYNVQMNGKVLNNTNISLVSFDKKTNTLKEEFPELVPYFSQGINSISVDSRGRLWVMTRKGFLIVEGRENGKVKFKHHLSKFFCCVMEEDFEGNFWISTQRNGLIYIPKNEVNVIDVNDGLPSNLVTKVETFSEDEMVVSTDDGMAVLISISPTDKNRLEVKKITQITDVKSEIYDVMILDNGSKCFFSAVGLYEWFSNKIHKKTRGSFKTGRKSNDRIWVGGSTFAGYLITIDGKDSLVQLMRERTYSLVPFKGGCYFGCVTGLYKYTLKDGMHKIEEPDLITDVRSLEIDEDSVLWIGTKSKGIYLYKDSLLRTFNTKSGLPSNGCKEIFFDSTYAWIATNNGVCRMDKHDYSVSNIGINDGLPGREINSIRVLGDWIIVATNAGLAYFKKDLGLYNEPPVLRITGIEVNGNDTTLSSNYTLEHYEKNIKIKFTGIAFRQKEDVEYQVKMGDGEWTFNDTGMAEFPGLSPGIYSLGIRTKTLDSEWSTPKIIDFKIKKAFWKRPFMMVVYVLLGVVLLTFVIYFLFRYIQKQNEAQERLKASRLTALRAQMNPHFMFNSLNSIQEFILMQDRRSANKYLSRFSRLMRSILDMSDKVEVSLEKEIEALTLYLDLEAMRFEGGLDYRIQVAEDVEEAETMLPSMLIQPYVENAIKHGLMHRKDNRILIIDFSFEGDYLVCIVEDNGIGREAAAEIQSIKKYEHESKAMSLTQERLRLLNSALSTKLNVDIEDKYENGEATGTKVTIYIRQI